VFPSTVSYIRINLLYNYCRVLTNAMVLGFLQFIFSALDQCSRSANVKIIFYYINVEFIEEFYTENLSKPYTCSVRLKFTKTVYDYI